MSDTQNEHEQPVRLVRGTGQRAPTSYGMVRIKCGDCAYLTGGAHPSMGKPCAQLGKRPVDDAPNCYLPDIGKFRSLSPDTLDVLMTLVSSMDPSLMRILLGVLRSGAALASRRLSLLQRVYFAVGDGSALSNWYSGYVAGITTEDQITVVGHQYLKTGRSVVTAVLDRRSLVTPEQFAPIKARLIASGALDEMPPRKRAAIESSDYEPPTMETSVELLEAAAKRMSASKKRRREDRRKNKGETVQDSRPRSDKPRSSRISMNAEAEL